MIFRFVIPSALLFSSAIVAAQAPEKAGVDVPQMEELTVYGMFSEPDRMTGSAHRISEEELASFQYDDINRVLNFIPGVYSREEDGVGLRPNIGLRGGSSDRSQKVTLMEDGVPISPAPYSAPAAYFFPLTSRMVAVEVFKGPSSIQHGPQTIGGAINLISAPIPSETELLAKVGQGSDAYRHLHLRGGSTFDGLGLLGEFVHMGSDGFKELDGGGDTGYEKNEVLVKASHAIGPGTLELRLGYADEISDETYLGLTEDDFRATPYRRYLASSLDLMEWDWTGGRAVWRQPFLGGQLAITGYTQSLDRAWRKFNNFNGANIRDVLESPEAPFNQVFINILRGADTLGASENLRIGTNDRTFSASGLQGVTQWKFTDGKLSHALEFGVRYHTDQIRRLHDEYVFEQRQGQLIQNNQPRTITADNTAETDALALWLRDEIAFGAWTFVPGLRVESVANHFDERMPEDESENDNRYTVVLPGFGSRWELSEAFSLIAGVHKGFSPAAPSPAEDTEAEESINYEFGGRWKNIFGNLELIGFYNDYSNLTATCTVSSGCSSGNLDFQTNAGKVRAQGLEAGWNHAYEFSPALRFPMALTFTYTEAVFRETFSSVDPQFGDVEAGDELPYIPSERANLSIGAEAARWNIQLSATYVARMRNEAGRGSIDESEGSDAYTAIDLAAHYDFSPHWTLLGRIDNILDDEYVVSRRPYGARPGKPLSFQMELSYRY